MIALVTGSSGFIGSHLCRALLAAGYRVRAFHRPSSPLRALEGLEVEHVTGDLTQPDTLQAAMQGVEVVFHAAAHLGAQEDLRWLHAVTVEGARAVFEAALQAGIRRVVHTSSSAALGLPERPVEGVSPALLDEEHTWNCPPALWPYGYAKYLAELEVQRAVARGLDAVIVNPTLVFGPGDVYRQNSSLIMRVARNQLPALVDGGLNVVHVADVAAGHLAALERGCRGERYILGGENLSLAEMVRKIAAITGGGVPALALPPGLVRGLARPAQLLRSFLDLPVDPKTLLLAGHYFYCSTGKAQSELGLPAPRPAEQAFADAWEWFQANGAAR